MNSKANYYHKKKRYLVDESRQLMARMPSFEGPPPFESHIVMGTVFRFRCTGAQTSTPVNCRDLMGVCGVYTKTANATVTAIATAVRIKRIRIWGPAPSSVNSASVSTVELRWAPLSNYTPYKEFEAESQTADVCPYLDLKPPKNSLAADWISSTGSTSNVFYITGTINTVIDLHLAYVVDDGTYTSTIGGAPLDVTVTTASTGSFYYMALADTTNTTIVPVSKQTTS